MKAHVQLTKTTSALFATAALAVALVTADLAARVGPGEVDRSALAGQGGTTDRVGQGGRGGRRVRTFPLDDGPWLFETDATSIRVSVVTRGISHPWSLAFLPDGGMLITEREGRLRIVRNGVLDPVPVSGVPEVFAQGLAGLMDVVLHPRFAENQLLYLVYSKEGERGQTTAFGRGRFDGHALIDFKELFVADAYNMGRGSFGSRIVFGRDGTMFVAVGHRAVPEKVQDLGNHLGKILRFNDDGTVPQDNPFVGQAGARPEIYAYGFRDPQGMALHPETGELWLNDHGPNGGGEINIVHAGKNYGWPIVSTGNNYDGAFWSEHTSQEGLERPWLSWMPEIAPSGMLFYTGDKFPEWQGNIFVGSLRFGEVPGTGHLERIVYSPTTKGMTRLEWLLAELHQRIRDVRQGPDGFIYVLTDEEDAALLRVEPLP